MSRREHPIINERQQLNTNDNRISLFVAQKGKCDVTDQELDMDDIHRLIHATNEKIIKNFFQLLNLSNTGLTKLNQLRELVGTSPLLKENLNSE